jgi:hypothetical protein
MSICFWGYSLARYASSGGKKFFLSPKIDTHGWNTLPPKLAASDLRLTCHANDELSWVLKYF